MLIFSDKCCEFPDHPDLKVAWKRWYKRAIEHSALQLLGARNWILKYPERIFIDSKGTKDFPVPFPQKEDIRFHLIAITKGSCDPCKHYFDSQSTGGLIINNAISESEHEDHPFTIGRVRRDDQYIHVFDELILDIALKELDTITDLVEYLEKKEVFLTQKKHVIAS